MKLGYFTEEAYEFLQRNIDQNINKYLNDEDWLDEVFPDNKDYYQESTINVEDVQLVINEKYAHDKIKNEEDIENVIRVYNAFKNLTPWQASNKYMWSYLCHASSNFRKYIWARWLKDANRDNIVSTISTRMFISSNKSSLRNDNALSRLWWIGYLTYDKTNTDDPYHYTRILLTLQVICSDTMDTYNCMKANRMRGVLKGLKKFIEYRGNILKMKEPARGLQDPYRDCNKYLNRLAAFTNLDYLEEDEISKLVFDRLIQFKKSS